MLQSHLDSLQSSFGLKFSAVKSNVTAMFKSQELLLWMSNALLVSQIESNQYDRGMVAHKMRFLLGVSWSSGLLVLLDKVKLKA